MVMEIVISAVLLLVGIAVLVVIHICVVGRLFREDNQSGASVFNSSSDQRIRSSTPKMSSEDLSRLPCFYHTVEGGRVGITIKNADCAVCLESFKGGEKCRLLPDCGHYFHAVCIDSWLLKTPVCPICRTIINFPEIGEGSLEEGNVPIVVVAGS